MTTLNPTALSLGDTVRATNPRRSWKVPIVLAVFVVGLVVLQLAAPRSGTTGFRLSQSSDFLALPTVMVPVTGAYWVSVIILALLTAAAAGFVVRATAVWSRVLLLSAFALVGVFAFLTWAAAGNTMPVIGLLFGSVTAAVPLVYGALCGVIGERVGVVNIAIEGQLLGGAFSAAFVGSITQNPYLGMLAATITGALISLVLAVFAIKYIVDQVIVGVVLNVLVLGLTSFLYTQVLQPNAATLNTPPVLSQVAIPLLSQIPIIGPVLFNQTIVVYLMYVIVAVVYVGLFRTRWGLRVRAVGEYPRAADTVGIRVNPTRFWNVTLAGAIAGLGGTFFTVGSGIAFNKDMTGGAGFIALAAVIFGNWNPIRALLAALLFGFATNLQNQLSVIGSPVPGEFMLMLPYVVTIVAVAGLVGKVRSPASSGKPYIQH